MAGQSRKTAFKPLKIKLSEIEDQEARQKIQEKFYELQFKREQAVAKQREAIVADRQQKISQAEAEISLINLLTYAGDYSDKIKTEPIWIMYNEAGELTFECPFSEADMRTQLKVNRASLNSQANQLAENNKDVDFYNDSEEE